MRQLGWAVLLSCVGLTACATDAPPPPPRVQLALAPEPVHTGTSLSFSMSLTAAPAPWSIALFLETPQGEVQQLLPNRLSGSPETLSAGSALVFPDLTHDFRLRVQEPGTYTALLFATPAPPNLSEISHYITPQDAFATVQPNRQGQGVLDTSFRAVFLSLNPGVSSEPLRFDVTP